MPKKRFVQAIELVKLQAKITDYQTGYYSSLTFMYTAAITFFIAMAAFAVQTQSQGFLQAGVLGFLLVSVLSFLFLRGLNKSGDRKIRKDIERIYNGEPIEF